MNMANWSDLVLLLIIVRVSISLKFLIHPEANLNMVSTFL